MQKLTRINLPTKEIGVFSRVQETFVNTKCDDDKNWKTHPSTSKNHLTFKIEHDSEDWSQQSNTTTDSWLEDMEEEAATEKFIEQWEMVERTLYDEEDQLPPGPAFDECSQWRNEIPHLRIIGKNPGIKLTESISDTTSVLKRKHQLSNIYAQEEKDDTIVTFSSDDSDISLSENCKRAREEIIDELVQYVTSTLSFVKDNSVEEENSLSYDLEKVLTIKQSSKQKQCNSIKHIHSDCQHRVIKDNVLSEYRENDEKIIKNKTIDEERKNQKCLLGNRDVKLLKRHRGMRCTSSNEASHTLHPSRNRTGMIFNERIIVSPMPFIRTTRESFSTLKSIPIPILEQSTKTSRKQHVISPRERLVSGNQVNLMRMPQVQKAWQPPVCPTIWPRNIRLTPIDTSVLPSSSKRRISTAISQQGGVSLSPISHHTKLPPISQNTSDQKEDLEIFGTHILPNSELPILSASKSRKLKTDGRKRARYKADNA